MNQIEAARRLGMKPAEIIGIERADGGHVVTTHDHQRVLVTRDGVQPAESPVSDAGGDQVPDGSADTVLQWAGQDAERIARALEAERAKPTPRRGLVAQLEKLATPE